MLEKEMIWSKMCPAQNTGFSSFGINSSEYTCESVSVWIGHRLFKTIFFSLSVCLRISLFLSLVFFLSLPLSLSLSFSYSLSPLPLQCTQECGEIFEVSSKRKQGPIYTQKNVKKKNLKPVKGERIFLYV